MGKDKLGAFIDAVFEFNSLATRILQKKAAKKIEEDIHEDEPIEEINEEECI